MRKMIILTLASLLAVASVGFASQHVGLFDQLIQRAITEEYGRPRYKHGGWADNFSAEVLHPKKGPLFTPRTWTNKAGRTVFARVVTIPSPTTVRFADYQNKEFIYEIDNLSLADQKHLLNSYNAYVRAQEERERIRSEVVSAYLAANPPRAPRPQRQPKEDSIEDRIEDMEAAAAAARMRQQQIENRQWLQEQERRFQQYR